MYIRSVSHLSVNLRAAEHVLQVSSYGRLTLWGNVKKLYLHCWIFMDFIGVYLDAVQIFEVNGLVDENTAAAAWRSCDIEGLNEKIGCHRACRRG